MIDKSRKKKHHYIPKFYLDGFCDQQGMVWTYHKNSLDIKPHCQKPENTAFIKNFYAIYRDDGSIDTNTFEDALADIVESPAASALKALRSCQIPSFDDRQSLSLLLGYMLVRTPSYRAHYEKQHNKELNVLLKSIAANQERFQRWADDYKNINNEPIANDIEQLRQEILNDVYQMQVHPNYSLNIMHTLGSSSAYLLASMKWVIIETPENLYFLTSDNPIIVTNPNCTGYYSPGLGMKNTRVFVPISKKIGLLMIRLDEERIDNRLVKDNKEIVKEMNRTIVLMASRFIYATEKNDKIIRMIENANSKQKAVQQKFRNENGKNSPS